MSGFIEYDVVPHHISKRAEATLVLDTGMNVVKCTPGARDGTGVVRFYGPDGSLHEMGVPGELFDALKTGDGVLRVRLDALGPGQKWEGDAAEPACPICGIRGPHGPSACHVRPTERRPISQEMLKRTAEQTPPGFHAVPEEKGPRVSRDSIVWAFDELDERLAKLEADHG